MGGSKAKAKNLAVFIVVKEGYFPMIWSMEQCLIVMIVIQVEYWVDASFQIR